MKAWFIPPLGLPLLIVTAVMLVHLFRDAI